IHVTQVPVRPSSPPVIGHGVTHNLVHPGRTLGFPGLEVTNGGGVLVFYQLYNAPNPVEIRYNTAIPGEIGFRDAVTAITGPPGQPVIGTRHDNEDADLPGAQSSGNSIWFSTSDSAKGPPGKCFSD